MTTYQGYERFQVKREGRILTVTFEGVSSLNFVDGLAHTELSRIFAEIAQDRETDVVVLTASGRAFCAGGDIAWFRSMSEAEKDIAVVGEGRKIVIDLLEVPQPIIAAVNGPAIGLGATLALFSDIVIASEAAVFADPHVVVGLTAGDGGAVIWPWLVGMNRAKEFLFTGDRLSAADALRIGLVNHVVPAAELESRAHELAERLARTPQGGLRGTKAALNKILRDATNLVLDSSLATERQCMSSAEHETAMTAFLESRRSGVSK
jgi:enoyl-CoA hydratase